MDVFHTQPAQEVIAQLRSDPKNGLPDDQVQERLAEYGKNRLHQQKVHYKREKK